MKRFLTSLFLFLIISALQAQSGNIDSLFRALNNSKKDSFRVFTLCRIGVAYFYSSPDTAIHYLKAAHSLAQEIDFLKGKVQSLSILGNLLFTTGNYVKALETHLEVLEMQEKRKDKIGIAIAYNTIAMVYREQKDYKNTLTYFTKAKKIFEDAKKNEFLVIALLNIGDSYEKMNKLDSALLFQNQALELGIRINDEDNLGIIYTNLGNINTKLGNTVLANNHYTLGIQAAEKIDDKQSLAEAYLGLSLTIEKNKNDSSIFYAKRSLRYAKENDDPKGVIDATRYLSKLFEATNNIDSAYTYFKIAMQTRDTMYNEEIVRNVETLNMTEQLRQQEIAEALIREKEDRRNNLQMLGIALFIIFLFALLGMISRKKYKPKFITYLGLMALLLLFEFISFFIHPYIANWTHHTPALILPILVGVGALLLPLHHRLEKWIHHKLTSPKKENTSARKKTITPINPATNS